MAGSRRHCRIFGYFCYMVQLFGGDRSVDQTRHAHHARREEGNCMADEFQISGAQAWVLWSAVSRLVRGSILPAIN